MMLNKPLAIFSMHFGIYMLQTGRLHALFRSFSHADSLQCSISRFVKAKTNAIKSWIFVWSWKIAGNPLKSNRYAVARNFSIVSHGGMKCAETEKSRGDLIALSWNAAAVMPWQKWAIRCCCDDNAKYALRFHRSNEFGNGLHCISQNTFIVCIEVNIQSESNNFSWVCVCMSFLVCRSVSYATSLSNGVFAILLPICHLQIAFYNSHWKSHALKSRSELFCKEYGRWNNRHNAYTMQCFDYIFKEKTYVLACYIVGLSYSILFFFFCFSRTT